MKARKKTSKKIDGRLTASKLKQKKVVDILLENHGKKKPLGEAMQEAGYSKAYATNPQEMTSTKTWQELMDTYLSEEDTVKTHHSLLHSSALDVFDVSNKLTDEEIKDFIEQKTGCKLWKIVRGDYNARAYYYAPDNKARKDAVEMVYKMRGKFVERIQHTFDKDIDGMTDEELMQSLNELLGRRNKNVDSPGGISDSQDPGSIKTPDVK